MTRTVDPVAADRRGTGGWPAWARELDSRLPVSPQMIVTGNVDDVHLVDGSLPLRSTVQVLGRCLLANGFRAVLYWQVASGLSTLRGSVPETLGPPGIRSPRPEERPTAGGLADLLRRVVPAGRDHGSRVGLIVEGAHRLAAEPVDPDAHALWVAARHLVEAAPQDSLPGDGRPALFNTVLWLVDRENSLPHWLVAADGVPVVSLPLPGLSARRRAAELYAPHLPGYAELDDAARASAHDSLAKLTQGMPLTAIRSVVTLAKDHDVPVADVHDAVRLLRSGLQTSPWHEPDVRGKIAGATRLLNAEVRGQERAVRTAVDALSRAALGLSGAQSAGHPSRPQGVLFFAGPTGVGKTELAKQIAILVFGREEAMKRFDMSEFSAQHSDARLIGSPPGYVGHDAGGELTNAVRQQPFSVLLFDEIEKAHPLILDKFLQILEDGRLTDGSGSTVHFTETLIIFTSNLGIYGEVDGRRECLVERDTPYEQLQHTVRTAIQTDFTMRIGRPELLNRIGLDNIVVFDFISPPVAIELLERYLTNVRTQVLRQTGVQVEFADGLRGDLAREVCHPDVLAFGGRGVGSLVESHVINPAARTLITARPGDRIEFVSWSKDEHGHHLEPSGRPGWARP